MKDFAKHIESGKVDVLSLLSALPCSTIIADNNEKICFWNERAIAQYQYTQDEIIGKEMSIIIPKRYYEAYHNLLSDKDKSAIVPFSTMVDIYGLRKDGTEFPIQLSIIEYQSGEFPCYLAVTVDTTLVEAKATAKLVATQLSILNKKFDELPTKKK